MNLSAQTIDTIFDRIFATAAADRRRLTSAELMAAIGLSRTSINSTYRHVNERRVAHNTWILQSAASQITANASGRKPDIVIAELRAALKAEEERSATYAQVIRELALQLHARNAATGNVIDGKARFYEPERRTPSS